MAQLLLNIIKNLVEKQRKQLLIFHTRILINYTY